MNAPSNARRTPSSLVIAVITFLFIAGFIALAIYRQQPPAAVPDNAPLTEFSSGRAMKSLREIAQNPHPVGSEEHVRVEEFLKKELTTLGVEPQVQEATAINANYRSPNNAGTVRNILARLKGTEGGKALLLVGHYDSVPTSLGASDNGAAVAAMLETLRALKAGAQLKHDVIFLFTDGEEVGSLGAIAFVEQHPWAKDVGVVLNFDARGSRGAAMMFETSDGNGWLVEQLAHDAPRPVANSLMSEIYRALPNNTDLTVFKQEGYPGLNFAYIDGATSYHTGLDRLENLDERSLQHQGSYVLSLARGIGNASFENSKTPNAVYFDLFGLTLVHYAGAWVWPLTALVTLCFIALVVLGLRRKQLSLLRLIGGFLVVLLGLISSLLLVSVIGYVLQAFDRGNIWTPDGNSYNSNLFMLGFAAFTIAITSTLFLLFRKRLQLANLTAGAMLWWLLLLLTTTVLMPGASYLFAWPLLFASLALGFTFLRKQESPEALQQSAILSLSALPALVLFAPTVYLLMVALPLSAAGVSMVLLALLVALLLPQLDAIATPKKWLLPVSAVLVAALCIGAGSVYKRGEQSQPKQNSIFYGLDADTDKAVWATADGRPDEWTSQFIAGANRSKLSEFFPFGAREFLNSQAPVASLSAPKVEILDDVREAEVRKVHMRITSTRQAPTVLISVGAETKILGAQVNGRAVGAKALQPSDKPGTGWGMNYYGLPQQGIEMVLEIPTTQPLNLRVVDRSNALPQIPGLAYKARPAYMIPTPYSYSNATFVSKAFTF